MSHDVFISHSSLDREVVDVIVAALEAAGIVCWIAPRDMIAAAPYTESIVRAIRECRALILVLTPNVAGSPHVLREVHQAAEGRIPILEFRAPGVDPALAPDLDYFLSPN